MEPRVPELGLHGQPIWWHNHGSKMRVDCQNERQEGILVIGSGVAKITIQRASFVVPRVNGWFLDWEIGVNIHGNIGLNNSQLSIAFDIHTTREDLSSSRWLIDRYGGDVAYQGKFIRWGNYLNIPCPGTGHDGDPNISVLITEDIKAEVFRLVAPPFDLGQE